MKEVCRFLGVAGYYLKFIKVFRGDVSSPHRPLEKECVVSMDLAPRSLLPSTLACASYSPCPGPTGLHKDIPVGHDACDQGIGAMLSLEKHSIGFLSHALGPRNHMLLYL